MPDLSEFMAATDEAKQTRCTVAKVRTVLTADQDDALAAALSDQTITTVAIAKVLSGWTGRRVTHFMVGHHRRGACNCG